MSSTRIISNGRIIDPKNNRDEVTDLFIKDGKISELLSEEESQNADTIDAKGLVVCPGLVDIHVHLREPGQTHKETIQTGSLAAAAGGFTSIVCMPNTNPAADTAGTIQYINDAAERDAVVHVYPTGCITQGRQGEKLAPIGSLKKAGVVAITDDGDCAKISALGPDERLALGSAFKLYVLATLADTIASGEMAWDDLLAIEEAWKSLPSGQMHLEAAGTEFALVEYAELMISISDNTATDHLIRHLERERVEQTLELAGHMAPEVNTPFITTREMFLLKGALGAGDRDDYLALDPDGRRRFLDEELASMSLDAVRAWPEPRNVDTIEWFASPEELCAAMVVLRGLGDATDTAEVNEVLSANPGVDFGAVDWPFIGFKGGSEPGVLNLTWLLRRDDGRWFFLSFGFVDTMDAFAIEEPLHLAIGAAQLLADH